MADSPLQKAPLGLLATFDLKVNGDNPKLFGELVAPTYDITQHYLLDRTTIRFDSEVVAATNAAEITLTLGNREFCYVRGVSAGLVLDAADVASDSLITLSIRDPALTTQFLTQTALTLNTLQRSHAANPTPFWLAPGWQARARVEFPAATTQPFEFSLQLWGAFIND